MGNRVVARSHARLAQWSVDYVAADSAQYVGDSFRNFEFNIRFPLLRYITSNVANHLEIAYADNAPANSTLEKFANLWLTCNVCHFHSESRADSAALLYFSLVESGDRYRKEDLGGFQPPPSCDYTATKYIRRRSKGWYDVSPRSLVLQAVARAAESFDLAQLFRNMNSSGEFWCLVEEVLVQSAIGGNDNVLDILLHYSATAKTCVARALLPIAALNLREGTAMFLLQQGVNPKEQRVDSFLSRWS